MNNRKTSFTKKEDELIMEGLATNPPAELGVTDNFSKDAELLRFIGQIVLEDQGLRKAVLSREDVQRWIKRGMETSQPKSNDETTQWPDDRKELPGLAS